MEDEGRGPVSPVQEPFSSGSCPDSSFLALSNSFTGEDTLSVKQETGISQKAKRRRTSAHDQAILEAAYQKNSKPDKNERTDIVSRVQLGEKEVQIWFQNRRQNDRRRCKPLQPHELIAHIRNSSTTLSIPTKADSHDKENIPSQHGQPSPPLSSPDQVYRPASRASTLKDILNPCPSDDHASSPPTNVPNAPPVHDAVTPPSSTEALESSISHLLEAPSGQINNCPSDVETRPGSARKRHHEEMTGEAHAPQAPISSPTESSIVKVKKPLQRSSSVRLSMTVDGAVKIRTNNEPTPSPPKQRALAPILPDLRNSGLTRSKSALDSLDMFKSAELHKPSKRMGGAGFGRSRDARTWEFYCDSSAKEALSNHAEAERNGSAIGAINLIRSNSVKSRTPALSPAPNRGNTRPRTLQSKQQKPALSRARSSLARLQSSTTDRAVVKPIQKPGHHARSPSGDSDKENWAPGTRASENPLRRTQASSNQRPVLRENEGVIFHDAPASQTSTATPHQQNEVQPSKSVASGSREGGSTARSTDLDCIQSLLSLSQGAWK